MRLRPVLMWLAAIGGALGAVWLAVGPDADAPHRPLAIVGLTLLGLGLCKEARRRDHRDPSNGPSDEPG